MTFMVMLASKDDVLFAISVYMSASVRPFGVVYTISLSSMELRI